MKKFASLCLAAVMLLSVFALASCAGKTGFDYRNTDLSPYVTLADYKNKKLNVITADLAGEITDEDTVKNINDALKKAKAYYKKIEDKSETVAFGDTVGILYKGVLVSTLEAAGYAKDGTGLTEDQIKGLKGFSGGEATSTSYLQIGSKSFINGFEDGLIDLAVGTKNYPLALTFPSDYKSEELKGKSVVFFVTIEHKLQLVEPRNLEFGDSIGVKYTALLDEENKSLVSDFKGTLTMDKDGNPTDPVKTILTLSKDDQFHSALILHFNEMAAEDRLGKEFTFDEEHNVSVTVTGTGADGKEEVKKEDRKVTVHYTVTVYGLADVRYFTHEEAKSGEYSWADFKKALSLGDEDYKDYNEYFTKTKEDLQRKRTIQIAANRYKGAFTALVKGSQVKLDSEEMKAAIAAYEKEVRDNIEVLTNQVMTDSNAYMNYRLYQMYYGSISVENYVMYLYYGYSTSTIDKKLPTDAAEYVTNRLVFWQFVKAEQLTLTDEEYNAGVENYKKLYNDDDFMKKKNMTEETLREALLWDKAAELLCTKYSEITAKPEKKS